MKKLTKLLKIKFNSFKSRFHKKNTNLILYGAPKSGKTECALREVRKHGNNILIVADTMKEANRLRWELMKKMAESKIHTATRFCLEKEYGNMFDAVLVDNANCMEAVCASLVNIVFNVVVATIENDIVTVPKNNFKRIKFI